MHLKQLFLRTSHEKYHFLKFVLEGYDGICLLSTVPGKKGCVCLRYPEGVECDLFELISSIGSRIRPLPV